MVEWSNTPVLKTGVPQGTGGSNPSLSATESCRLKDLQDFFRYGVSIICPPPIFNNYVGFDVGLFSNIFVVGIKKCQLRVSQRIVGSQNLYRDEKTIIYYRN